MSLPKSSPKPSHAGTVVAAASLVTTVLTGLACTGPLLAIVLGIGGLGFLTRYAHLQVPASIATAVLLGLGFAQVYWRGRPRCSSGQARSRWSRALLWSAATLAVAMNVFEYLVFPRL